MKEISTTVDTRYLDILGTSYKKCPDIRMWT